MDPRTRNMYYKSTHETLVCDNNERVSSTYSKTSTIKIPLYNNNPYDDSHKRVREDDMIDEHQKRARMGSNTHTSFEKIFKPPTVQTMSEPIETINREQSIYFVTNTEDFKKFNEYLIRILTIQSDNEKEVNNSNNQVVNGTQIFINLLYKPGELDRFRQFIDKKFPCLLICKQFVQFRQKDGIKIIKSIDEALDKAYGAVYKRMGLYFDSPFKLSKLIINRQDFITITWRKKSDNVNDPFEMAISKNGVEVVSFQTYIKEPLLIPNDITKTCWAGDVQPMTILDVNNWRKMWATRTSITRPTYCGKYCSTHCNHKVCRINKNTEQTYISCPRYHSLQEIAIYDINQSDVILTNALGQIGFEDDIPFQSVYLIARIMMLCGFDLYQKKVIQLINENKYNPNFDISANSTIVKNFDLNSLKQTNRINRFHSLDFDDICVNDGIAFGAFIQACCDPVMPNYIAEFNKLLKIYFVMNVQIIELITKNNISRVKSNEKHAIGITRDQLEQIMK